MDIVPLRGQRALEHIEAIGQLRIIVFREFPYLFGPSVATARLPSCAPAFPERTSTKPPPAP